MRLLIVVLTILAWPLGAAVVLSQEPNAAPAVEQEAVPTIDPSAIEALGRMTTHLRSLGSYELTAQTSTEHVLDDGLKVMFDGVVSIKVRRPNAFMIDVTTDRKTRQYYYDGSKFTLVAPRMGFYATVDAPPTIRETLDVISERYGIETPLRDVMDWSDTDDGAAPPFTSAVNVGYAKVNGVDCGHYAFRTESADLQLWIPAGAAALPQKIVITSLLDDAHPQFVAGLAWQTNPALADATFTFIPPADAKPIIIASYEP